MKNFYGKAFPCPFCRVPIKKHKKKRKYAFRFPTKKVFYKPTHVEVNYHTLHIVFLFKPDQVYFPIKLDLQHVAGAFQR